MSRARRSKKSGEAGTSDPSRWAHLIFVLGAFVGAWVLTHAIEDIWSLVWDYWPRIGRVDPLTANALGIGIALAATVWAWRKPLWFQYTTEVVTEVTQVAWPTKAEVRVATVVVIMMTLICSAILAGIDTIWSKVTDLLYGI
ncbi:MAG: preprotein translocase subunit SecE [Deltaproteobacteria bacterium]|nr:preprotein translocase subunit SecE [Nannocystaceae bacterium]